MEPVLVFAGPKYYPKGGAADLKEVLLQPPTEDDLVQVFKAAADREGWLSDDFWMHTIEVEADGVTTTRRWLVFIRKEEEDLSFEEAGYASVVADMAQFKVLFVPVVERVLEHCTWIGPRDYPEVTFF